MTKTEGIFTFPISMTPPQYSILGPTFGSKAEHCPIKTNTAENLRFFDKKKKLRTPCFTERTAVITESVACKHWASLFSISGLLGLSPIQNK